MCPHAWSLISHQGWFVRSRLEGREILAAASKVVKQMSADRKLELEIETVKCIQDFVLKGLKLKQRIILKIVHAMFAKTALKINIAYDVSNQFTKKRMRITI